MNNVNSFSLLPGSGLFVSKKIFDSSRDFMKMAVSYSFSPLFGLKHCDRGHLV